MAASRYLSTSWLAMIETEAQRLLNESGKAKAGVNFSLAEWLSDAPPAMPDGTHPHRGFLLTIVDGVAKVRGLDGPHQAGVTVELTYALGLKLSKLPSGDEFNALAGQAVGSGQVKVAGDPSRSPFAEHALHDAIASHTL